MTKGIDMRKVIKLHIDRGAQIGAIGCAIDRAVREVFASLTNEQVKALVESSYVEIRMDLLQRRAA